MADANFTGLYTLTPTHCGTGQTSGAVDLPIARETHTGFPVLPASGLKGAARHAFRDRMGQEDVRWLFGSDVNQREASVDRSEMTPGALIILEGRLLLYPVRSLQRPFFYATCPLILERLDRDLRALGLDPPASDWKPPDFHRGVRVTDESLVGEPLVVEDLAYTANEVGALPDAEQVTRLFSALLPAEEATTRKRLTQSLVVLDNNDFADVVRRVVPVQARIRLTDDKTTSGEGGNLWYEETIPSDCLFGVFITKRSGLRLSESGRDPCQLFLDHLGTVKSMQIGGHETVGQGYCWWTEHAASGDRSQGGGSHHA
jgi:CRISPR-associated protein Cmr4